MNTTKRKNLIITLLPAFLIPIGIISALLYRDSTLIKVIRCPLEFFFGIYCPGCGATHAVFAMINGHFIEAVKYNAVFTALFVFAFLFWLENFLSLIGKRIKIIPESRVFYLSASGIAIIYFILRNFIPFLSP